MCIAAFQKGFFSNIKQLSSCFQENHKQYNKYSRNYYTYRISSAFYRVKLRQKKYKKHYDRQTECNTIQRTRKICIPLL
ncbi:MAG: DUF2192 domain-containing protein [Ruminococcus sp.]|nr:DUF2192 domain-containing protein [Ruminococcus sp.]